MLESAKHAEVGTVNLNSGLIWFISTVYFYASCLEQNIE